MEEVVIREEIRDEDRIEAYDDPTVGSVYESIETNLWLAEGYFRRGHQGLAIECLREAWMEYVRFRDILMVYSGSGELGERLVRSLVEKAGDSAASLALGEDATELLKLAAH